mgnify:CR=1 FL=1
MEKHCDCYLNLYKRTFDATEQFITVLDNMMCIKTANKAFLNLIHEEEIEKIYNTPYWEIPLWSHSYDVQNRIMFAIEEIYLGAEVKFETTYSTPDDEVRYVEFTIKPIFDETGEIDLLLAMGYDVTNVKSAESELERKERELEIFFNAGLDGYLIRKLEKPVKLDYSNLEDMFELTYPYEKVSKYNESFVYLTQVAPENYNGYDLFDNPNIHTSREALKEYFPDFVTKGNKKFEKNFVLNDGTKRYLEFTSVAIINNGYYTGSFFIVKDITSNKKYEEKLFNLANFDMLTSISNRRYFISQVEQIMESDDFSEATICTFDIDNFKSVNDNYGHDIGDIALADIAKLMNDKLEGIGIVARMGGEEFSAFLNCRLNDAGDMIDDLLNAVRNIKIELNDHCISLKFTISGGMARVKKGDKLDKFLKKADTALYDAKHQGRDRYCIAKEDMDEI